MRHRALALLLAVSAPALADSTLPPSGLANTELADPAKEAAARALMETIRCLVCQGQSIADSDAELAGDMRALVRRRIAAGEQPEAVRAWLVERYGGWVSYRPGLDLATLPLWIAPLALLLGGAVVAGRRIRRRRTA